LGEAQAAGVDCFKRRSFSLTDDDERPFVAVIGKGFPALSAAQCAGDDRMKRRDLHSFERSVRAVFVRVRQSHLPRVLMMMRARGTRTGHVSPHRALTRQVTRALLPERGTRTGGALQVAFRNFSAVGRALRFYPRIITSPDLNHPSTPPGQLPEGGGSPGPLQPLVPRGGAFGRGGRPGTRLRAEPLSVPPGNAKSLDRENIWRFRSLEKELRTGIPRPRGSFFNRSRRGHAQ